MRMVVVVGVGGIEPLVAGVGARVGRPRVDAPGIFEFVVGVAVARDVVVVVVVVERPEVARVGRVGLRHRLQRAGHLAGGALHVSILDRRHGAHRDVVVART